MRQQKDFGKRRLLEGCSTPVNSKKKRRHDENTAPSTIVSEGG